MRNEPDQREALPAEAITVTRTLDRWRVLRIVCAIQGLYYVVTGLWPLLHLLTGVRVFSATNLVTTTYATALALVFTILLGVMLLVMALRTRPEGLAVALGVAVALAFFLVEGRFRSGLHWAVYVDLVLEVLFVIALLAAYGAARLAERRLR